MPRTYAKTPCFHCGQRVSTNGMARASHARKHVREGLLVGLGPVPGLWESPIPGVRYMTQKDARRTLDGDMGYMYQVEEGTLVPVEADDARETQPA